MAKISIIIPVYNAGKYIAKSLDALCQQTFSDIEILCVDDGSTDNSGELLDAYAAQDPRFKVLRQQNSGPAAARNLGLENATSPYVMFCDADDWYEPDYCEKMFAVMETHQPDVVVAGCQVVIEELDCAERAISISEECYNSPREGLFELSDELCRETSVVLWNKIFKKELIDRYHIRFPQGCEHDDDAFWMMYGMVARKVYFLKERMYNYLIRANSIMSNYFNKKPKNKYDRFKISCFVYDFWRQKLASQEKRSAVSEFFRHQIEMMFFDMFSIDELKDIVNKANQMDIDYCFAVYKGKIFTASKVDLEAAGRIKLLKYIVLSKLTSGRLRKKFKHEKRALRNQLKMKKLIKNM